MRRKGLPHVAC